MSTIEEAKHILRRLPIEDRHVIAGWLEGFQVPEIISGPEGVVELRSLGIAVPLAEIYRGVFPESAEDGSGPE